MEPVSPPKIQKYNQNKTGHHFWVAQGTKGKKLQALQSAGLGYKEKLITQQGDAGNMVWSDKLSLLC